MKTILLASILIVGLFPAEQETWKIFEGKNFSVQYPADWQLNKDGLMGTTFVLFAPMESATDNFRENVNMVIQDLQGTGMNLDAFIKLSEEQVKTLITNSSMIENKRLKKGNREFQHMNYTGDQGMFHFNYDQYVWVIGEKAYILTFTAEQTKVAHYKQMGTKIMDSFKIAE